MTAMVYREGRTRGNCRLNNVILLRVHNAKLADGVGFEPTSPEGLPDFESGPLNLSGNRPPKLVPTGGFEPPCAKSRRRSQSGCVYQFRHVGIKLETAEGVEPSYAGLRSPCPTPRRERRLHLFGNKIAPARGS